MMAVALAHSCVMLCTLESTRHELGTTRIWRRMAYLKVHISNLIFYIFRNEKFIGIAKYI